MKIKLAHQIDAEGQNHQPANFAPQLLHEYKTKLTRITDTGSARSDQSWPEPVSTKVWPIHCTRSSSPFIFRSRSRPILWSARNAAATNMIKGATHWWADSLIAAESSLIQEESPRPHHFAEGRYCSTFSATCLPMASFPLALK